MVNPSLIKVGEKLHPYFKARYKGGTAYGLATSREFEGPYAMNPNPLTNDGNNSIHNSCNSATI